MDQTIKECSKCQDYKDKVRDYNELLIKYEEL